MHIFSNDDCTVVHEICDSYDAIDGVWIHMYTSLSLSLSLSLSIYIYIYIYIYVYICPHVHDIKCGDLSGSASARNPPGPGAPPTPDRLAGIVVAWASRLADVAGK